MKHSQKFRLLLSASAVLSVACSDDNSPSLTSVPRAQSVETQPITPSGAPTIAHYTTTVARLSIRARGPFRPNSPIQVILSVNGQHAAQRSYTEITTTGGGNIGAESGVSVKRWETPLEDGAATELVETISFAEPGYYGLMAGVWVRDADVPVSTMIGDSMLVNHDVVERWILVDENGGRFDEKYNGGVAAPEGKDFAQGSVGQLRSAHILDVDAANMKASTASRGTSAVMSGIVTFLSADSTFSGPRVGVPNALVVGDCKIGPSSIAYVSTSTNANGQFYVTCPAAATSYQGTVKLENSTHRIYVYSTFWAANTSFNIGANNTDSLAVIDDAGKTFVNHTLWNLAANTMFGRSRAQMRYVVNPGSSGSSAYSSGSDIITMYTNGVWGGWGEFVVSHEYGHAFHYKAIDPWVTYDCSPGGSGHAFNSVETSSCAYVEGFADFFAAIMLRMRPLASQGININGLESSVYRLVGQGLFIEHPFAATLWDLFDNIYSPDSYPGDDDAVSLTAGDIADIMVRCRLYSPSTYLLSHTDQFIYCAEGAVNNAKSAAPLIYQSGWGYYGAPLSYDGGTPNLPNTTDFRSIWKYALYGI